MDDDSFLIGFCVGMILVLAIAIIVISFTPMSKKDMCNGMIDIGYNVAYVSDLDECLLITEDGLLPFNLSVE